MVCVCVCVSVCVCENPGACRIKISRRIFGGIRGGTTQRRRCLAKMAKTWWSGPRILGSANNVHESFDKRQASSYKSTSLPSPTGQCYVFAREMFSNLLFGFLCKVGRVRAVFHGACHKYHTEWLMDHSVMTLTVSLEVASNHLSNPRTYQSLSSPGTIKWGLQGYPIMCSGAWAQVVWSRDSLLMFCRVVKRGCLWFK